MGLHLVSTSCKWVSFLYLNFENGFTLCKFRKWENSLNLNFVSWSKFHLYFVWFQGFSVIAVTALCRTPAWRPAPQGITAPTTPAGHASTPARGVPITTEPNCPLWSSVSRAHLVTTARVWDCPPQRDSVTQGKCSSVIPYNAEATFIQNTRMQRILKTI